MNRWLATLVATGIGVLFMLSEVSMAAGDATRGARLHEDCLGCHGTELYVPPVAKVKTLSTLKQEVERWNDRMNPKFTKQEIEDLVAYLNANFYKLTK